MEAEEQTSTAVSVSYVVTATVPGATYTSLTSQLYNNIANDKFNGYLATYGAMYYATGWVGCTSNADSLTTVNDLDDDTDINGGGGDDDDSQRLSAGGIVGIAIAVLVFLIGANFAVRFWRNRQSVEGKAVVEAKTQVFGISNMSQSKANAVEVTDNSQL